MAECKSYPAPASRNTYERKTDTKIICDHCHKPGHKAPNCRKRQKKLREKGKMIRNIDEEDETENEEP